MLVVEDTSTTGGSALTAVNSVREAGGIVVGVATVVDRSTGGAAGGDRSRGYSLPKCAGSVRPGLARILTVTVEIDEGARRGLGMAVG